MSLSGGVERGSQRIVYNANIRTFANPANFCWQKKHTVSPHQAVIDDGQLSHMKTAGAHKNILTQVPVSIKGQPHLRIRLLKSMIAIFFVRLQQIPGFPVKLKRGMPNHW